MEDVEFVINDGPESFTVSPETFHKLAVISVKNNETINETVVNALTRLVEDDQTRVKEYYRKLTEVDSEGTPCEEEYTQEELDLADELEDMYTDEWYELPKEEGEEDITLTRFVAILAEDLNDLAETVTEYMNNNNKEVHKLSRKIDNLESKLANILR
jgi:uncharacterized protein Yka (UPF0111/DUF47 family)